MTPEERIAQYERDIAAAGLPLPDDYKGDPADMQIDKLDDRLREGEPPARIWAKPRMPGYVSNGPVPDVYDVEYVRSDLVPDEEVERLRPVVANLPWADASTGEYRYYEADVGFGGALYYVADHEDSTWSWGTSFTTERGYAGCHAKGLTFDAAKAAAQADYNRRIRAALRTDKEGQSDD